MFHVFKLVRKHLFDRLYLCLPNSIAFSMLPNNTYPFIYQKYGFSFKGKMGTDNFAESVVSERTIKAKIGVLDTSALIKAELNEICCFATQLFTVQGIYTEVKDKQTKRKLQFLPNFITIREPSEESFKFVCNFAKLAGCYNALSLTDLQILALTHQLHVEAFGPDSVNETPTKKIVVRDTRSSVADPEKISVTKEDRKIPGFYDPSSASTKIEKEDGVKETTVEEFLVETFSNVNIESYSTDREDDDDDSWLTLENIEEARKVAARLHFDKVDDENLDLDEVVCITLDYAMQNVLSLMGIPIMSVDGVKTSKIKSFVLRCNSCGNKTPDVSRKFCPSCGNKTMKKLFYSIGEHGEMTYHFSKYFVSNTRGLKYRVPAPQGGKHGQNPWVAEDQRFPLNQASKKSKLKNLPLDPDYVAKGEPFTTRDVSSRYFNAGIHCGRPWRNPNDRGPNTGNRKRNKKS